MNLIFEVLDKKKHNFKNFDCGKEVMNSFLKRFALKNQKLNISKTWVVFNEALRLCETGIPAYAVILDVLDEEALAFYQKFNFLRKLGNSTNQLFVRMTTLEEMFNKTI